MHEKPGKDAHTHTARLVTPQATKGDKPRTIMLENSLNRSFKGAQRMFATDTSFNAAAFDKPHTLHSNGGLAAVSGYPNPETISVLAT